MARKSRTNLVDPPAELVGWYNKRKAGYSGASNLSLWEWSLILHHRVEIISAQGSSAFKNAVTGGRFPGEYGEGLKESLVGGVLESPFVWGDSGIPIRGPVHELSPMDVMGLAKIYADPLWEDEINKWKAEQPKGVAATHAFYLALSGSPPHEAVPTAHACALGILGDKKLTPEEVRSLEYDAYRAQIGIDLSLSNETLVSNFKTWLEGQRKLMTQASLTWGRSARRGNRQVKFSDVELRRWSELRVLDYIDAGIVSNYLNIARPTATQFFNLIFKDKGKEVQQKKQMETVQELTNWLLEPTTLRAMKNKWLADYIEFREKHGLEKSGGFFSNH